VIMDTKEDVSFIANTNLVLRKENVRLLQQNGSTVKEKVTLALAPLPLENVQKSKGRIHLLGIESHPDSLLSNVKIPEHLS